MICEKYRKQHETTIKELTRLLHEKKYNEIADIIEMDQENLEKIGEYFEEFLEDMGYEAIDVYGTPCLQKCEQEVIYANDVSQDFSVDYYLTAEGDILGICLDLKYREVDGNLKCTFDFEVSEPEEDEYYLYGMEALRLILNALHEKDYQRIEQNIQKTDHGKVQGISSYFEKYFQKILADNNMEKIDDFSIFNEREEDFDAAESCTLEYQLTADQGKDLGTWLILKIEGKKKKVSLNFEEDED